MIRTEFKKQKKNLLLISIFFPLFLNALLYLDLSYRYDSYLLPLQTQSHLFGWQLILKEQTIFYFSEFFYIIFAVIIYDIFTVEFKNNAWLTLVSSKSRKSIILKEKFLLASLYSIIFWVADYVTLFIAGYLTDNTLISHLSLLFRCFISQALSGIMILAFYLLMVSIFKRVLYLIPLGIVLFVAALTYYPDAVLKLLYPFTYISHTYKSTGLENVYIGVISIALTILFHVFSKYFWRNDYSLK